MNVLTFGQDDDQQQHGNNNNNNNATTRTPVLVVVDAGSSLAVAGRGRNLLLTWLGCLNTAAAAVNVVNGKDVMSASEDALLMDLGGPARIVLLATCQATIDLTIPALQARLRGIMIEVHHAGFDARSTRHSCPALSMVPILENLFVLPPPTTTLASTVLAPSLPALGLRRGPDKTTTDLDIDVDLPLEYRANLKWVSRCLVDVAMGLGLVLGPNAQGICSLGVGAGLVANSCCAKLTEMLDLHSHNNNNDQVPARQDTLLIIDRTLDWFTPLSLSNCPPAVASLGKDQWMNRAQDKAFMDMCSTRNFTNQSTICALEKLHDNLCSEKHLSEVVGQIVDALANGSISQQDAKILALRAYSKVGGNLPSSETKALVHVENRLSMALSTEGPHFLHVLREASLARLDVARYKNDGELCVDYVNDTSVVKCVLDQVLEKGRNVKALTRASTGANLVRLAKGLLSSFLPLGGTSHEDEDVNDTPSGDLRRSRKVVVFFLGGVSFGDFADVLEMFQGKANVVVGGTHLLDRDAALMDATTIMSGVVDHHVPTTQQQVSQGTDKKKRDIAKLFDE